MRCAVSRYGIFTKAFINFSLAKRLKATEDLKLMLQAASEFGLTPSSRSRIVAGNAKGKEPEDEMETLLGGDA